jgi:DNA-binding response OmpR family regulator
VTSVSHPGAFIIVEDEPVLGGQLVKAVTLLRQGELVTTAAAAYNALSPERQWTGAIVDVGLPDASGLDVVQHARALMPLLPVLILTGRNDPHAINKAHELRCEFRTRGCSTPRAASVTNAV